MYSSWRSRHSFDLREARHEALELATRAANFTPTFTQAASALRQTAAHLHSPANVRTA
jgi:hypothetical protein